MAVRTLSARSGRTAFLAPLRSLRGGAFCAGDASDGRCVRAARWFAGGRRLRWAGERTDVALRATGAGPDGCGDGQQRPKRRGQGAAIARCGAALAPDAGVGRCSACHAVGPLAEAPYTRPADLSGPACPALDLLRPVSSGTTHRPPMKSYSLTTLLRVGTTSALIGAAVGTAVGVLIAPDQGARVRRRLAFRLDQGADALGGFVQDLLDRNAVTTDARALADAVVADAEAEADRIRHEIDRLMERQKSRTPEAPPSDARPRAPRPEGRADSRSDRRADTRSSG